MNDIDSTEALETQRLLEGAQILRDMLARSKEGIVSAQALRKELEQRNIADPQELVARLKSLNVGGAEQADSMRWYHFGRSFLTEARYQDAQRNQENDAAQAAAADDVNTESLAEDIAEDESEAAPRERRKRRREEGRLGAYILPVLEELYDDQASPETYVFDVHSVRAGSDYENVDLLAVHWRSNKAIDVITVEVKLKFSALLVQQARNYQRFSERVWLAVPVDAIAAKEAAMELRAQDQLLFEHVIEVGLGILACHRGRGGAYDIFPIQWPRRGLVDPREREEIIRRYRSQFEECGVVPPVVRSYPKL